MKKAARAQRAGTKKKPSRARPRIGRPPGNTSAQTRASILVAARACFVRVGFERATNRDVAAAAGVTAAAIYQYFDSKTELYLAAVSETIDELIPRVREIVATQPSARAALAEMVREMMSAERRNVASSTFLSTIPIEMQRHPAIARGLLASPGSFFNVVLEVVGKGVRKNEIAADKAERVLAIMIAALIGLSVHSTTVGGPHSEAATQGFIDLLEGKLFK